MKRLDRRVVDRLEHHASVVTDRSRWPWERGLWPPNRADAPIALEPLDPIDRAVPEARYALVYSCDSSDAPGDRDHAPDWIHFTGGTPIGVDDSRSYTTFLAPGTYYLLSIGADEEGPFAARGLLLPIEVEAPLVDCDATVTLLDHEFVFDGDLVAGPQILRVHNGANQPHEMIMFPLPPGMSLDDMLHAMMEGDDEGGPPGAMVQGIWAVDPGVTVYVSVDLGSCTHGILCFISDADGPHFMSGMAAEVVVQDVR